MEELPKGMPLGLNDANIALISRLAAFDVGNIFSKTNEFNNEAVDYASFVFAADTRKERDTEPQRTFRLRAIVHYESDLNLLVDSIRRNEPKTAVRVVQLSHGKLRNAVQYDPQDGRPNADVSISA